MSGLLKERWLMTAEFDSVQDTIDAGVYEGGPGEAAEFYEFCRRQAEEEYGGRDRPGVAQYQRLVRGPVPLDPRVRQPEVGHAHPDGAAVRFDQDWAIPLLITAIAILAGLIAWLVTAHGVPAIPGRPRA